MRILGEGFDFGKIGCYRWVIPVDATVLVVIFRYGFDYFEKHSGGVACALQEAGEEEFKEFAGGDLVGAF